MARGMDVTFNDVTLRFKNFSGKETEFNSAGNRNFRVDITPEMAEYLGNIELTTKSGQPVKGANIKTFVPKNETEPRYSIQVKIGDYEPDQMWYVTSKGKIRLTLDNVGVLDRMYIEKAKVQVHFSAWEMRGKYGIAAYLKNLVAWVREDDFADDLEDIPEIGGSAVPVTDDEDLPF